MLGTKDQNGFNAGMFMVRINEWSVNMLAEVVALRQLEPTVDLPFFDQTAIDYVVKREGHSEHVLYQTHNWWNAFGIQSPPFDTDLFTLHFAGVDCCGQLESKATVMGRWLEKLENDEDAYYKPLDNLTLSVEVSDYWAKLSKARKTIKLAESPTQEENYDDQELQTAMVELNQTIFMDANDLVKVDTGTARVETIMTDLARKGKSLES